MMTSRWPHIRLDEVLTERREDPSYADLVSGRIRIVSRISFRDGQLEFRDNGVTATPMILVRPGDLVVSGINALKGAIGVHDNQNTAPVAATIHYSAYVPKEDRVNVTYLWWLLRSRSFQNLVIPQLPKGIKTELKPKRLLSVMLPIPPLDEQESIVHKITEFTSRAKAIFSLSEKSSQRVVDLASSMVQAILSRFPIEGTFADVITENPRSGPSFPTSPEWRGQPVVMPSAVTGFGLNTSKVEFGPGNEYFHEKDLLRAGDILIARGNKREQVGNAGIVPAEASGWVCANLLMRLRVDPSRCDPEFALFWLKTPFARNYVKAKMTGTSPSIQKINQKTILSLPFPTQVPLAVQQHTIAVLRRMESAISEIRQLQAAAFQDVHRLYSSAAERILPG